MTRKIINKIEWGRVEYFYCKNLYFRCLWKIL